MVSSIAELYVDYKRRLDDVDSVEQDLLQINDKAAWTKRLVEKSKLIRDYYRMTEKELQTYIAPILEGKESLDDKKARELYEGAYDYFMNVMCDDVLESQMFVKLWDYFHRVGDEYIERSCRCAFSNNAFLNVEGTLQRLAMEQAEWVAKYMDRIDHLREMHANDEDFVEDVRRVMGTLKRQYEMESGQFQPDVNRLIACFNRLSKIRKYRSYFSEEDWAEVETELADAGTDVMFMAALNWNRVDEKLRREIGPAFPVGFIEQTKLPMDERNMKIYVGYVVYAFYSKLLKPEQTFTLIRSYYRSITKEYDFNDPNWYDQPDDSRFSVIRYTTRPMLQMIREFSCDEGKKRQLTAELLYDVKVYVENIPQESACKEYLDQCLYHLLYDLIEYIDDREQAIEFIDSMIISRQLATLIHTVMTAKLTDMILERMIDVRPELFLEVADCATVDEVRGKKRELLRLMYNGARCHDIGKILIANIVNTQIRRLSEMEFSYIKFHPKWSYEILMRNPHLHCYAEIALGHHRSYDGKSGYPISFDNTASKYRIFIDLLKICDCMDAATDILGRNYANGKDFDEVMKEFAAGAGTEYNPDIVAFLAQDKELAAQLKHTTSEEGRIELYYHIYRRYR